MYLGFHVKCPLFLSDFIFSVYNRVQHENGFITTQIACLLLGF